MKLAKLKPLTENFIKELYEGDDEEKEEDELEDGKDEMEFSPEAGGTAGGEELPPPAPEGDMGEPSMGGGMEDKVEDIISAIADAIAKETGVQVSVQSKETADPAADEPEMPESEPTSEVEPSGDEEVVKEDKTLVSGDRSEEDEDLQNLPTHDKVVEETKMFGGTQKDAKYTAAPKAKVGKVNESKKLTKQQQIKVLAERVAKRLMEMKKVAPKATGKK